MVMFAVREVVQELLVFSPADLVFGHTVRGPLKLIRDYWSSDLSPNNVPDYVSEFCFKLHNAYVLAKENLEMSQQQIKKLFKSDANFVVFFPGDQVLVLLSVPGFTSQALYYGSYQVKEKVSELDYMITTSDRKKKKTILYHINML